mgnify:CR=1 FL=1
MEPLVLPAEGDFLHILGVLGQGEQFSSLSPTRIGPQIRYNLKCEQQLIFSSFKFISVSSKHASALDCKEISSFSLSHDKLTKSMEIFINGALELTESWECLKKRSWFRLASSPKSLSEARKLNRKTQRLLF